MFFLRCAFWLSVVYSSMSWTNIALQPQHGRGAMAMGRSVTEQLTHTVVAGAADLCAHRAAECVSDAARLTSLFAASDPSNDPEPSVDTPVERDIAPLPVPDPRRHAGGAKLAHAS